MTSKIFFGLLLTNGKVNFAGKGGCMKGCCSFLELPVDSFHKGTEIWVTISSEGSKSLGFSEGEKVKFSFDCVGENCVSRKHFLMGRLNGFVGDELLIRPNDKRFSEIKINGSCYHFL